jgi:hypothetical protein
MKTIISVLIAIFILEMLPLNLINANQYVRIVMEATDVNSSEDVLKRSSDIITGNFTAEELQYISILGNNGELPVAFRIVN